MINKATTELSVTNLFYLFILSSDLNCKRNAFYKIKQAKKMEANASINILNKLKLTANPFFLNPCTLAASFT